MAVTPPPSFALTQIERGDPLWVKLKAYLLVRLDRARADLEKPLDEPATAHLRGQIAELRALLGLDREMPPRNP